MSGRRRDRCGGHINALVAENIIDILKIEFGFGLRTLPQVLNGHAEECSEGSRE